MSAPGIASPGLRFLALGCHTPSSDIFVSLVTPRHIARSGHDAAKAETSTRHRPHSSSRSTRLPLEREVEPTRFLNRWQYAGLRPSYRQVSAVVRNLPGISCGLAA